MFPFSSGLRYQILVLAMIASLSGLAACEPIIDFSSTAPNAEGKDSSDTIRPTQAAVRPKESVAVPKDPLLQILLLTNDSSKGWQLKKRQRQGLDVMQPCNQDDGMVIFFSKRIDIEIGPVRCGPNDQKQTGSWQLTDRPSLLVSNEGGTPYEVQLLELSSNRMVISYIDEENVLVLEGYETPVAQEPIEEGPIVLTPTPAPTPAPQSSSDATEPLSTESLPPSAPGSGAFKTGR